MTPDRSVAGPLAGRRLALAGAGRVGTSLGAWARAAGAEITVVANRGTASRERTGEILAAHRTSTLEALGSGDADVLLVAVADPALDEVAALLARRAQAPVILHVSGSRDAAALAPLAACGAAVGSLHPLRAFPEELLDPAAGVGTVFGIDGTDPALARARELAVAFGGEAVSVPPEARLLYHYGATMAAGGVVSLLAIAAQLAGQLGVDAGVVRGYLELARGAVATATTSDQPVLAITGPLARGDRELVRRQFAALAAAAPQLLPLARELALATLRALLAASPAEDPRRPAQRALLVELAAIAEGRGLP